MGILLDTHTYLWFINDDPRLSTTAAERIADPHERVLVSVVSAWEIIIKLGTGKLSLDRPIAELWPDSIASNEFDVLNVTTDHVLALSPLPSSRSIRPPSDRTGRC